MVDTYLIIGYMLVYGGQRTVAELRPDPCHTTLFLSDGGITSLSVSLESILMGEYLFAFRGVKGSHSYPSYITPSLCS